MNAKHLSPLQMRLDRAERVLALSMLRAKWHFKVFPSPRPLISQP